MDIVLRFGQLLFDTHFKILRGTVTEGHAVSFHSCTIPVC